MQTLLLSSTCHNGTTTRVFFYFLPRLMSSLSDDGLVAKKARVEGAPTLDEPSQRMVRVKVLFVNQTAECLFSNMGAQEKEVLVLSIAQSLVLQGTLVPPPPQTSHVSAAKAHLMNSPSQFRRHFLDSSSAPQILDKSLLMDVEMVSWLVWDTEFACEVPLTSEQQFCDILRRSMTDERQVLLNQVSLSLRIVLKTCGHSSSNSQLHHSPQPLTVRGVPSHDDTPVGPASSAVGPMIRLPTHLPGLRGLMSSTPTTAHNTSAESAGTCETRGSVVRIFLVRHGESEANKNLEVYRNIPDHAIPLTDDGKKMASAAGGFLRGLFERESNGCKASLGHVRMLVSPYERTRQTAKEMLRELNRGRSAEVEVQQAPTKWVDSVKELPYLAEQDFGLCEGNGEDAKLKCTEELDRITLQRNFRGKFWSRFPHGESPFDVAVRMAGVITEITSGCSTVTAGRGLIRTYIIVSHGLTSRAFISAWCCLSPEWIADSRNPPNCSIQLVEDGTFRGYVFGGFERGKEVHVSELSKDTEDPMAHAWDQYFS